MKTLGIIGYGSFGAFAADKLSGHLKVRVHDPNKQVPKKFVASLDDLCDSDYLVLAIPLSAYEPVLKNIKPKLGDATILIDISSVKLEPIRLIKELLPAHRFIATHPLFGPESASKQLRGHTMVLCESMVEETELEEFHKFCRKLGLAVETMSADEHDRQMAIVQSLTFFVSRALNQYGLHEMKFKTPSFQRMLHLAELDNAHSDELLNTILLGNKYALEARRKFMRNIEKLDALINHRD